MIQRRRLLWLPSLLVLVGCQSEETACVHEPALSYENFGQGFLEKNCNGCHSVYLVGTDRNGAPLGVDFNTYADVVAWHERIAARGVPADAGMPPGGGPTEADRALLAEWLGCQVASDAAAVAAQDGEDP